MIVQIVSETGWTWEYVEDTLTLSRENSFRKRWEKVLPMNDAITRLCAYAGVFEPQEKGNLNELIAMAENGGVIKS